MAGVIGIIKSWSIIKSAVGLAAKEMGGKGNVEKNMLRTQRDLSMKIIAIGSIITLVLIFLFFYFDVMQGNLIHTLVAIVLVAGISFLFTTVAANAIAIVGTNPVSGMTLMTLILASVVMVAVGLKGPSGMVAALVMGGVVCTALSMAGGFITDLKIGYWLGSTPAKQETWKFLGTIVSAATVGGVMIILNKTYGFTSGALAAPQANAMAAVIEPLMSGVGAPWLLYGIGAILAIILTCFKVPALAFALGMFIPLELNVQLVCDKPQQRCFIKYRTRRKGYFACFRFHCRRRFDGCDQCSHAFRRSQSRKRCLAKQHLVAGIGPRCLCFADSLLYQGFDESKMINNAAICQCADWLRYPAGWQSCIGILTRWNVDAFTYRY